MSLPPVVRAGATRVGLAVAWLIPPRAAYAIIPRLARFIRRRGWRMYTVLRENLAHLPPGDPQEPIDDLAERAVGLALRTYYELYRSIVLHRSPEDITLRGEIPRQGLPGWEQQEHGLVIGALHMSNFDLAGAWLIEHGLECQILSLANPDAGYQLVNRLRRKEGMNITPISRDALRQAVRRLKSGGAIVTGIDRPIDGGGEPLPFFGHTALMPVGHVRLALQTNARFMLAACLEREQGRYEIIFSDAIEMSRSGDRATDIRANALAIIHLAEEIIASAPDQWLVFTPVWPETAQPETGPSIS